MGKDTTAFKQRFNDYKNGKPVSEIYDAGLPRYGDGKNGKKSRFNKSVGGKYQHVIDNTIDYLHSQGVDPILIAGILGNMAQESGFDPDSIGPGGFAGTVQMSSDMAKEIKRAYGKVDYQTTNRFIHDSMSGNKIISQPWRNYMKQHGGYYGRTFDSAGDAAMAFGRVFERPNEKYANWEQRMLSAEDALDYVNKRIGTPIEEVPISQTTTAEYNAAHQFQPWQNYHQPDYPLNNPAPSSISSWNNPKSPAYTPAGLQTRRIDFGKMMMDMLEDDWEPPVIQPLKTVAPPDSKVSTFTGFKNGKLPGYKICHNVSNAKLNEDGTFTDDYTKVFEDMYVTPQKADLKRGSYTLNNFPYYLQHRTDWMKPFMSSATNEKGLESVSPEFDLLLGGRQLYTELIPIKTKPTIKQYDNIWDKHYFDALSKNDLKGAENLREAHFRVKAPNTRIKQRQYHSISDEYNPNFNSFDTKASGVESSIYTTDDPIMSGNYTKELVSEKELDNIIEETRQQQIYKLAKNRPWTRENKPFFMDDQYWIYADPKKAKAQILKDFKWLNNPIHPERQKQLYVNLENPFIIDAKNKYWSHFDYEDFPKDVQNVIRADMYSDIYHPYTTRSIEHAQKQLGYDGAIINNVIDYGGRKQFLRRLKPANVIQINDPKNIKYADTVVYDDSGNIIPLSLRDNFEINDLRFKNGKLPGYKNGKIHIKPANRGKFNATKKRTGKTTEELAHSKNPLTRKRAIFALNARKWKH